MTLRECYEKIGADYNATLSRMSGNESLLSRFVMKFRDDPTYSGLVAAYESGDVKTAFRMAHTLKGVCLNLGFDKLRDSSSQLTEALRSSDVFTEESDTLFAKVKEDYELTMSAISSIA